MVAQQALSRGCDVRSVNVYEDKMAVLGKFEVIVMDLNLNRITSIKEKFQVQSAFWESEDVLFYTTSNHWKYALMNGENGILKTIEEPLHLLKKIDSCKFLAFSESNKVFEEEHQTMSQIQFKLAVGEKDWEKVRSILKKAGQNRSLLAYLVEKGYSNKALDLVENPEEKFSLAIQSTDFHMAFNICREINTQEYWKMLGDEALKQGIYEAYEVACQKQKNYDKLNFLYSLQGNREKMEKMQTLTKKMNNQMLGFNTALFLNDAEEKQVILRDLGLGELAALSSEAQSDPEEQSELLKRLGSRPLEPVELEGQANFENWPHNEVDEEGEDEEDQS